MSDAIDLTDILAAISQNNVWTKESLKLLMLVRQKIDSTQDVLVTHAFGCLKWDQPAQQAAPAVQDAPVLPYSLGGDDAPQE
jgi:hypothetical protein